MHLLRITAENFTNLKKETDPDTGSTGGPNKVNPTDPHQVILKLKWQKGIPIRLSADFSSESLQARGSDIMYLEG